MKLKELVDKKKFLESFPDLKKYPGQFIDVSSEEFMRKLGEATLSPAELEGELLVSKIKETGMEVQLRKSTKQFKKRFEENERKARVLGDLNEFAWSSPPGCQTTFGEIREKIKELLAREEDMENPECRLTPVELEKLKRDGVKARAWDKLYKQITTRDLVHWKVDLADMEERMDELLAQSKIPPKAEEKSNESN